MPITQSRNSCEHSHESDALNVVLAWDICSHFVDSRERY